MSLSSQLALSTSPLRRWLDVHIDRAALTAWGRAINDQLAQHSPLTVVGSDPRLVGTAMDYGFRWYHPPLEAAIAYGGARIYQQQAGWDAASAVVNRIIREGTATTDPTTRARCCIVLAWFENTFRGGRLEPALQPFVSLPDTVSTTHQLYQSTPSASVTDVATLLTTVPSVWGTDLTHRFVLNPTFTGSRLVDGADADWIVDATLYDCKCSARPRPFEPKFALQMLGYVLLDLEDRYHLQRVGWYFARQQVRLSDDIAPVLTRLFGNDDLPLLRTSLEAHLAG